MTNDQFGDSSDAPGHELHELDQSKSSHTIDIERVESLSSRPLVGVKKKTKGKDIKGKYIKGKEAEQSKVSYLQLYRFASSWDWACVLVAQVRIIVIKFTAIGAVIFVAAYGQMYFFTLSAENQTKKIRERYLHAILHQDISWHDTSKKPESLNSRLSADTQLIFDGLADKVGLVLSSLSTFVSGFIIAFIRGWRMSLVLLCAVPLMAAAGAFMAKFAGETSADGQDAYAAAGGMAEQAIAGIRTIVAFDGQKRELINYGLAFWYGSRQVYSGDMESGDVLTVLFSVVMGAFGLGNVGPNIAVFAKAQAAAFAIFKTIDRVPNIDSSSASGLKPDNLRGHIVVKPGQTVALVGHSGSGKSTIIGLIERFYDLTAGSIILDGHELEDINVHHLRDNIGLVSQEPILFSATIKQNIAYGIRKDQATPTDKEIEEACRLANAHEFISLLPNKYNTMVGERGTLLSGGQKQRIAIARALIKDPRILLLDEATSALDTESERVVQTALDNASTGRSTVVIAHRLSTIMGADLIYVMDKGVVMKSGTHESLMTLGGIYADFVAKQQLKSGGTDVVAQTETQIRTRTRPLHVKKKEAARKLKMRKAPIQRTIKYLSSDAAICLMGVIFATAQGVIFPGMSQVMSRAVNTLTLRNQVGFDFIGEANHFGPLFVVIGICALIAFGSGQSVFMLVGERMTHRMRYLSYQSILSQEMAFFDRPENSTGALASRLATDSQQMLDMVSQVILTTVASLATLATGLSFAFSTTWQMALIILAAMPIIGFGQYLELAALTGFGEKTRKAYKKSGQVAGEAITNIRTVVSLAKENKFEALYSDVTREPHKYAVHKAVFASLGYALSQGTAFWSYSIGFYGGYLLVEADIITWQQMFNCMLSIVFAAMSLGHITSELPKYVKGKQSAINIYELLDKVTAIDADRDGVQLAIVKGALSLEKVEFAYPTRPDVKLFQEMDIKIKPSQTVAIVGPTGHMALVGQEPVLFDISIKDNILYGLPDNVEGTMEQVEAAAKQSNIHDFVLSLPQGYDTSVGDKGSQLSGGQKQRIAIARALIRNPKILLLDEATSALDSKSEKQVQETLDKARAGRTTIVIAHRLSTIQDADLILVVKDGSIVESGCHYELVALGGVYATLCTKQNL
ncbi:Multidrug resistance protein 1 [Dissophora ornata]|nr:Multidrug resistance protein 1 [Dissophora ornata]